MQRAARCRCGACAIEVQGEPLSNLICHCTSCRRRTGGPCGWTATFRRDQLTAVRGEFVAYASDVAAGPVISSFCARCGSTMLFEPQAHQGLVGCAGGCFVDPPLGEPTVSASDDQRCAWLGLPPAWTRRTTAQAEAMRAQRGAQS